MSILGWVQIVLVLALVLLAAVPLGRFIARVLGGERTFLSPMLGPVERVTFRLAGIDPTRSMGWRGYTVALLMLSAVHFLLLYAVLRAQYYLPFNPQGFTGMSPRLAFNTAVSFVTNTNWQAYAGETTLSNGAQMFGLTVHNFLSAAAGIAAAAAVSRAFRRVRGDGLGNFWADLVRITLYVLLPLAIVVTILLIALGVPQTMLGSIDVTTLEGAKQTLAIGPVAFQEAIKLLGTNGGGFFNVNSAHPFENPGVLSDIIENWSLLVIPFAMPVMFGCIAGRRRDGAALLTTMMALLLVFTGCIYAAETAGNPLLHALGVSDVMGNMEGKEVRFGQALNALFAASTTATSTGAVIAMHDSLMPLGGLVTLLLMQLGEVVPGGVGSGLYSMLVFALLAVFVAGLMVGRTPEYLGKKVQAREIKLAMLAVLILPLLILGGTAISLCTASGLGSLANAGPHGLSEMLYAWTSATANNGSAFGGLSADTPLLDYGLGIAMLFGRFAFLVPVLAIAGSLAAKPTVPPSAGTFPTDGPLFVGLLAGVILILGGLQFLPALSLGPLAEHFAMLAGKTF
ncbi:potassium-transporting ATPase subunit KdpA [Rhizosaccharibacter radicis]|uniref:Potassium-transporting ATPase potassium-binding subunit n=1 Tax=Rhizosaccharibacter radicis TaxID=2782605 RepID=A0ABT1W0I4_9PROT|nr:potassium-transporting ATPase subunit KdpA [Acetobacteraceae bacterium KSS12]